MRKEIKKVAHLITKGDVIVYFGTSERVTGINMLNNTTITPKQKELLATLSIEDYQGIWAEFNAKRDQRKSRFENQRQTILRYQELEKVLRLKIGELEKLKTEIFSLKQQKQHFEGTYPGHYKDTANQIKHIPFSIRGFREEMIDVEHRLSKVEVIVNTIHKSWLYRKFVK